MVNTGLNGVEYAGNFLEAVAKVFIERAADEEGGLGKYTFVFPNSMADTFPFSGIRYAGTAGCGVKCSSPFFMDKIWLPNIICFHILINSMVDPLKRATKPLP